MTQSFREFLGGVEEINESRNKPLSGTVRVDFNTKLINRYSLEHTSRSPFGNIKCLIIWERQTEYQPETKHRVDMVVEGFQRNNANAKDVDKWVKTVLAPLTEAVAIVSDELQAMVKEGKTTQAKVKQRIGQYATVKSSNL